MKQVSVTTISGPLISQIEYFKPEECVEHFKADIANAFAKVGWEIANSSGSDNEVREWHNVLHMLTVFNGLIDDLHNEANRDSHGHE